MKLKDKPKIEWPREKLEKYGPGKLSNADLLAIILRSGKKGQNVISLASKILNKFGDRELAKAGLEDLKKHPGLGPAKACEIIACFELGRRLLNGKKTQIYLSPKDVWNELREIREHKKEHFMIFYLDTRNQEIKRETISIGSLNASLVHPREVFEPAIRNLAAQIILAHNHPSGDPEPSDNDLEITRTLVKGGKILGIAVVDHIIVTKDKFLSFKGRKLM